MDWKERFSTLSIEVVTSNTTGLLALGICVVDRVNVDVSKKREIMAALTAKARESIHANKCILLLLLN